MGVLRYPGKCHEERSEGLRGARICRGQERDATTPRQEGDAACRPKRSIPIPEEGGPGIPDVP